MKNKSGNELSEIAWRSFWRGMIVGIALAMIVLMVVATLAMMFAPVR